MSAGLELFRVRIPGALVSGSALVFQVWRLRQIGAVLTSAIR